MRDKLALTKGRVICFVCCALLPAIGTVLGIWILINGVLLNVGFAITYFALPMIALGLLAWCVFSGSKAWKKVILSGVILVLFVISYFWFSVFTSYVQIKHYDGADVEQRYAEIKNKNTLMPDLSGIGESVDIECHNVWIEFFMFAAETDYLICHYTPEEYQAQKAALETKYIFQTEFITESDVRCEPSTDVDGYQFRLLSVEEYKGTIHYPKELVLIGYSDVACKIVYAAFIDLDLDYIRSLKDFVLDDCGWKYLR